MAIATYAEKYAFARSEAFTDRVQMACVKTALAVLAPEANPTTERTRLAHAVLNDPTVLATDMALAVVMGNFGVDETVSDAGLQTEVDTLFGKFAQ